MCYRPPQAEIAAAEAAGPKTKECPECGATQPLTAKTCSECGAKFPPMKLTKSAAPSGPGAPTVPQAPGAPTAPPSAPKPPTAPKGPNA